MALGPCLLRVDPNKLNGAVADLDSLDCLAKFLFLLPLCLPYLPIIKQLRPLSLILRLLKPAVNVNAKLLDGFSKGVN